MNDDDWLRDQSEACVLRMGLHFLHEALSRAVATGGAGAATVSAAITLAVPRLT